MAAKGDRLCRQTGSGLRCALLSGTALAAVAFTAHPALAGTCNNGTPPYDVPAQNTGVQLDIDCAGTGGEVNVTGDVESATNYTILDDNGGSQDWEIIVGSGVEVDNVAATPTATIWFQSPNGSLDNSGTIKTTTTTVGYTVFFGATAGAGSITNRSGGTISNFTDGNSAILFQAGGTLVNEAGGVITTDDAGIGSNSAIVVTGGAADITNAGAISSDNGAYAISANSGGTVHNSGNINGGVNFFIGGTLDLTNSGTINGGNGNAAIRTNGIDATVTNSGAINAGAGASAIDFSSTGNQTLILLPGSAIVGDVLAGTGTDTLRFSGTGAGTFDLAAIDTGGATQQYQAFEAFEVDGGTWSFNNATTADFILNGGALMGNGTFGDLTFNTGSTLAPGNSVGTVNTANATFNAGSVYEVELNAGGFIAGTDNDLLSATGTVTINGGTVHVTPENGTDDGSTYTPGTYTIITAAGGGVNGAFSSTTPSDDYAFLDFALTYDANNVFLTSSLLTGPGGSAGGFCLATYSANQCAAGDGAFSLGGGSLYNAVLGLSNAEAPGALDQLSGDVHASGQAALVDSSRHIRDMANERVRAAFEDTSSPNDAPLLAYADKGDNALISPADPDRGAVWGQAFGALASRAGNGNAAAVIGSTGGLVIGADAAVTDSIRLGLLAGYSRSGFSAPGRASSGSSDGWHAGLYGGGQWGGFGLRAAAAYSWHSVATSRTVAFTGFSDTLTAGYGAGTAQAFAETSYRFDTGNASFEPYAALAHVHHATDGFTETGGAAALTSAASAFGSTFTTLGVRAETEVALAGARSANLSAGIGWRHAFGNTVPTTQMAFAGGAPFTVSGSPIARDALVLDFGADIALGRSATLGLSYSGQIAAAASEHAAKASFAITF